MIRALRRAIKPALLWWNAWLYQVSEEEIQFRSDLRMNVASQGTDPDFCLRKSAEQFRLRLRQRKLRAQRDKINQW